MEFGGPLILVEDIQRSRDFYEGTLKRTVKDDFKVNVAFEGVFSIHLKSHYQELTGLEDRDVTLGSNSFELYFETQGIDGIYEDLKSAGVEFLHEVQEQPWAQRVIRFYDPDRHLIEIGEDMGDVVRRLHEQGETPEQIHTHTSMPMEFVEAALGGAARR